MIDNSSRRDLALVVGASGYIGSNLVPRLLDRGYRIRAVSRNSAVLEARAWPGVECHNADALDPTSLERVLPGVDVAWYLVRTQESSPQSAERDRRAAVNFRDAAARYGVRRIVYLSCLAPTDSQCPHLQLQREIAQILREGEVPATEIRSGMVVGAGSAFLDMTRDVVNRLPLAVAPRWAQSRSFPIALEDLLTYLVEVVNRPAAAGKVYDATGPDFLSFASILRRFGRMLGREPAIIPVPVSIPWLSSRWLDLVSSVPSHIAQTFIAGLARDLPGDDDRLQKLIPIPLRNLEPSIELALATEREGDLPAHWAEKSIPCKDFRPPYASYAKKLTDAATTTASAAALWQAICSFGADNDYFSYRFFWWFRGAADWLLGGPSFRRPRRDPAWLRLGDVVDAWRVIDLQPGRKLTLLLEMRLPGAGVLEFELIDRGADREVRATAHFQPAGAWGMLYWFPLIPFHHLVFRGMTREIVRRAVEIDRYKAGSTCPESG